MRIRAYIPSDCISNPGGIIPRAFGEIVSNEEVDPNITLPTSVLYTGHLPAELVAVVHHYSIHDVAAVYRRVGIYGYKNATATVSQNSDGKCWIEADGKTLVNVAELNKRIKEGSIAPIVSYSEWQVKSTVLGVKEAFHSLIDSITLAFGQWRLRLKR